MKNQFSFNILIDFQISNIQYKLVVKSLERELKFVLPSNTFKSTVKNLNGMNNVWKIQIIIIAIKRNNLKISRKKK